MLRRQPAAAQMQRAAVHKTNLLRAVVGCAENLEYWFCSEAWTEKHSKYGKSKINQVVVYHLDATEIDRPIVEPKYDTLTGGKATFAFQASLRPGVVGARHWGGWCEACQRGFAPGNGLTSRLEVPGCTCADRGPWIEQEIKRRDASGVANRRKLAQAKGHQLARQLKVGMWIAVQAREPWSGTEEVHLREGHYWLARVVNAGQGNPLGAGVVRKVSHPSPNSNPATPSLTLTDFNLYCCASSDQVTERRVIIQGNLFTQGDIVIAVTWYDRLPTDPEGLKFRKWTPPQQPDEEHPPVVNSSELRAINVNVVPFVSTLGPRPVRQSPRLVAPKKRGKRAGVVHTGQPSDAIELPDDTVYDVHADADVLIRRECW